MEKLDDINSVFEFAAGSVLVLKRKCCNRKCPDIHGIVAFVVVAMKLKIELDAAPC